MPCYAIIETYEGWTVMEVRPGTSPEETALKSGGLVVDPGPFESYQDACEAMLALQDDDEE